MVTHQDKPDFARRPAIWAEFPTHPELMNLLEEKPLLGK